jgi:hypothetical protein
MLKIYCVLTLNWYMVNLNSNVPSIDDLVLPLIIIPNEKINRTLRMIEVKQNELWVSSEASSPYFGELETRESRES